MSYKDFLLFSKTLNNVHTVQCCIICFIFNISVTFFVSNTNFYLKRKDSTKLLLNYICKYINFRAASCFSLYNPYSCLYSQLYKKISKEILKRTKKWSNFLITIKIVRNTSFIKIIHDSFISEISLSVSKKFSACFRNMLD